MIVNIAGMGDTVATAHNRVTERTAITCVPVVVWGRS
jgi:hypothetical protein